MKSSSGFKQKKPTKPRLNNIFLALTSIIKIYFTESGELIAKLNAHNSTIQQITFTTCGFNNGPPQTKPVQRDGGRNRSVVKHKPKMYFLSYTKDDVKIYDLEKLQMRYELSHERPATETAGHINFLDIGWSSDTQIIVAGFIPHTNKTFLALSNDTIQVWNWGLRTRSQIPILRMRSRYLRQTTAENLEVFYDPSEAQIDDIVVNMTQTTPHNIISDVQFTPNGGYPSKNRYSLFNLLFVIIFEWFCA